MSKRKAKAGGGVIANVWQTSNERMDSSGVRRLLIVLRWCRHGSMVRTPLDQASKRFGGGDSSDKLVYGLTAVQVEPLTTVAGAIGGTVAGGGKSAHAHLLSRIMTNRSWCIE